MRAYGGPQHQLALQVMERFSEAIESAKVDVVPKVMIASGDAKQGNAFEALLALLLSDKPADRAHDQSPRDPRLDHVRDQLRDNLVATLGTNGTRSP